MSCGVCPGDLQDRGMAVIGRNFYSGSSRQTYMCVPPRIRQYAMSSQTNAASQYAQGATNMQPRSQYQSQVRQHATSYVSDQYARPISLPVYQIMFSGGAKLEDRIESPRGLEEKVGTEMYSSQRILNASRNFDEIQDRARETMGKVLSLAAKREALEREIKESLEIAEAA